MPSVPTHADAGWDEDPAWLDRDRVAVAAEEREAWLDRLWNVDQLPDGTFRWTTPSGRSYDTEPTCYPV